MEDTKFLQKHLSEADKYRAEAKELSRGGDIKGAKIASEKSFLAQREAQKALSARMKRNMNK